MMMGQKGGMSPMGMSSAMMGPKGMAGMGGGPKTMAGPGGAMSGKVGGISAKKTPAPRSIDESGEISGNTRSALDDPNLANVAIVGVIYIFNKPKEEPAAVLQSPGAVPAAAPLAGADGATKTPAPETASQTGDTADSAADEEKPAENDASASDEAKPGENPSGPDEKEPPAGDARTGEK